MQTIFEAPVQLAVDPMGTFKLLRQLGVDRVRVFMSWASLAPRPTARVPPKHFNAASPGAYPAAAWAPYDAIVRTGAAAGVGVDLNLTAPPPLWASGSGAPPGPPRPQWRPSARDFGLFVKAVAKRYNGAYKPAGSSAALPRVSFWSIWNEPNYGPQLAPQAINHSTVEVSPGLYRQLVDAGWTALHETGHGGDTILIGEIAPRGLTTGDNPGNFSGMVPLRFVRALYCVDQSFHVLQGVAAAERGCPDSATASKQFARQNPALFKASGFAVHPYPQSGLPTVTDPTQPDYADFPKLPKLEATLDRVNRIYGSNTQFPLYSTEYGYKTNPPYAAGVDLKHAAAYLNEAEYLSWRNPRIASWDQYLLADPAVGNFATGLEFLNTKPKPFVYDAFRMPVYLPVASAEKGQSLEVWGCVRPAHFTGLDKGKTTVVQIQFKQSGARSYKTIKPVTVDDADGYFDTRVTPPASGTLQLSWAYPGGPTIHSRPVSVTVH
jgi:hypothetical protein